MYQDRGSTEPIGNPTDESPGKGRKRSRKPDFLPLRLFVDASVFFPFVIYFEFQVVVSILFIYFQVFFSGHYFYLLYFQVSEDGGFLESLWFPVIRGAGGFIRLCNLLYVFLDTGVYL